MKNCNLNLCSYCSSKSYETESALLNPVISFMDELSNSVKNRNNKNNIHSSRNGFMKQSSPDPNKNLLMLKNYVDQGFFSKRNRIVSEWSDSGLRYYTTCKYANYLVL